MAESSILMRLDGLKIKYEELGQKLTDPEVIADVKSFVQYNKEYKELEPIIETSERYRTAIANLAEAKDILANDKDEEMREMARMEISELEPQLEQMEEEIKLLLIPKDPQDDKNAILEIRGGTGGDEAAIFAGDLFKEVTAVNIDPFIGGVLAAHIAPDAAKRRTHKGFHIRVIGTHIFKYFRTNIQKVEVPRQSFQRNIKSFETLMMSIFGNGAVIVAFNIACGITESGEIFILNIFEFFLYIITIFK